MMGNVIFHQISTTIEDLRRDKNILVQHGNFIEKLETIFAFNQKIILTLKNC